MNNKLTYTLQWTSWFARAGEFLLNGVKVQTPCFMPVGTKGTIKGIPLELLNKGSSLPLWDSQGTQILLANTMHLYLRPWDQVVKDHGWLHTFMHRDKLILTDSWWFQIFSLGLNKTKTGKSMAKIYDDHVVFTSIHDGSKHTFTPTGTVDIQCNLWSDIMMMLDVCAPVQHISKSQVHTYMNQTHRRAKLQYEHFTNNETNYHQKRWVLFPIIQWWLYHDLRKESVEVLCEYARDGIGIWWLSVGETLEEMEEVLAYMAPLLPKDKPRYLMGVWTPESMLLGIKYGIDMFDCVAPTRLGRHGIAYALGGNSKLTHHKYKWSTSVWLADGCPCHVCKHYSLGYLNHLFTEWEMLGGILLSLHNIAYLHHLCEQERARILR